MFILTAGFINTPAQESSFPLIPKPEKTEWLEGKFSFSRNTGIACSDKVLQEYFISQVNALTGVKLNSGAASPAVIVLNLTKEKMDAEEYKLSITEKRAEITASSKEGLFRGMQTFFQLIPPAAKAGKNNSSVEMHCVNLSDKPRFSHRGLNLDCGRHFMSKDFIKRYIDILAYYKFNTFHWHLTEDQGWRIEIKKYPNLTKVGAWRKESDGSIYGGFYTQDDIKEIVAYAQSRYINIIPEIEMPGHSLASLASYPENSCTGGPFEPTNLFGVFNDIYCAGNEGTYKFLQDVLDEVIALFPGKYVHIGGDEAPKIRWKECPKCQAKIKAEGLKDEHELQSYFIKRMASYLTSKGKTVIGWDEVLQGGLAPGIIVQSWQSFEGAVDAAKQGHYVVCSPASHTYLNGSPENLDLRIAYSFEPVPPELNKEEAKYIMGGEVNLWTERAPQETVDSKLFPRILALAEVFWSDPKGRSYDEFYSRLQSYYPDMTALGIEYGQGSKVLNVNTSYDGKEKSFIIKADVTQSNVEVRYAIDKPLDNNSALYKEPFKINGTNTVQIGTFRNGRSLGDAVGLSFVFHKALNSKITLSTQYNERYRASGPEALIDGVRGSADFRDGCWQGYEGVDLDCVIDLGEEKEISTVAPRFFLDANSWIFLPSHVEISLSKDNVNYSDTKTVVNDTDQKTSDIIQKDFKASFGKAAARYIKVKAIGLKQCPEWHPYAGGKAWLMADEIVVE
jgi:hexosaminidase